MRVVLSAALIGASRRRCRSTGLWSLREVAAGHENGFYNPGALCLSTRRKDLTMRWRGRQVDIKDVLRDLDVPPGVVQQYHADLAKRSRGRGDSRHQ